MPPEIAACLFPGEELLWQGQPRPSVYILRGLPNLAYGVTWGVLGAFWYHGSGGIGEKYSHFQGWWRIVPLLSLPFILTGFSFWLWPLRLGPLARRTWYLVTNQRIFIAEQVSKGPPRLRVFDGEEMCPPHLTKRIDGLYDLILTRRALDNPHLPPASTPASLGSRMGKPR